MNAIYLIDFENVNSDGLQGIQGLTAADKVMIFYSPKADKLSFKMHLQIIQSPVSCEYLEVAVGGKNALDHQISTYLGFLIAREEAGQYYIVSKDNGYEFIANFWNQKNANVRVGRIASIKQAAASPAEPKAPPDKPEKPVKPNGQKPDAKKQDAPKQETQKQNAPKPNGQKPDEPKPDAKKQPEKVLAVPKPVAPKDDKATTQALLPAPPPPVVPEAKLAIVEELLDGFDHVPIKKVRNQIMAGQKQQLCNTLRGALGQERGLQIYREIKDIIW